MSGDGKSGKVVWISVANVLACAAVIILHCNNVFWSYPKGLRWISSLFLESFFLWGVPVFFMLSGATLLSYPKRYSTKVYLKKRFQRTVPPFLAWTGIGLIYRCSKQEWHFTGFRDLISDVLNTNIIHIYWFFIPLFAIYLSIPLLAAVSDERKLEVYRYLAAAGFLFVSVLPVVFSLLGMTWNQKLVPPVVTQYMIYVLLGYLIRESDFTKRQRAVIYLLGILGWILMFAGTWVLSAAKGSIDSTFRGNEGFPAVLQAAAVFTAIRYVRWEKILHPAGIRFFEKLSGYTFGVYLMHYFFIFYLQPRLGDAFNTFLFRTLGALGIFAVCSCICRGISKVPGLRKIIGL